MTEQQITDSQFHMWRALFALVHADGIVTDEEVAFMARTLEMVPFSEVQGTLLREDIQSPQDPADMFIKITDQADRVTFFKHARMLVWCDGDFDQQEQQIMTRLRRLHTEDIDFSALKESADKAFELEDEESGDETGQDEGRFEKLHEAGRVGIFHALAEKFRSH